VVAYYYNNPPLPFQVTTGMGGCPVMGQPCFDPIFRCTALSSLLHSLVLKTFCSADRWSADWWWFLGMMTFGQLTIHSHLTWEHTLGHNRKVLDTDNLVQHKHGPLEFLLRQIVLFVFFFKS